MALTTEDSTVQIVPQEQLERENGGQELSESWNDATVNVFKKLMEYDKAKYTSNVSRRI